MSNDFQEFTFGGRRWRRGPVKLDPDPENTAYATLELRLPFSMVEELGEAAASVQLDRNTLVRLLLAREMHLWREGKRPPPRA